MLGRLFSGADAFYHTAQLNTFYKWLATVSFRSSFFVFVDLPLQSEMLDASRKNISKKKRTCGFIICQTNKRAIALTKLTNASSEEVWHLIWYAVGIEIWENEEIHCNDLPLRFGLTVSEKKELLKFARAAMKSFFNGDTNISQPKISKHLANEKTMVDVAIWVDGRIRGSIISPSFPLIDAVRHASLGALRDTRMKPIEQDELERARVEITVMSDLNIPLRKQDLEAEKIDACRGYYVESDLERGWYLPTVFNCTKFKNMFDLRNSLIKEKAKISGLDSHISLCAFQTESFIEDKKHAMMLMEGPVAHLPTLTTDSFLQRVKKHSDEAAEWLTNMCDEHGAMPLYVDPLYQRIGRMDWGRLALVSYALAEYGIATGDSRFVRASEKISDYIRRYIFDTREPSIHMAGGVVAYLLHAELSRNGTSSDLLMKYLCAHPAHPTAHPIIAAVYASLFARLSLAGKEEYQTESESLARKVFLDFKDKKSLQTTQLAMYPELIYTFQLLYLLTHDPLYIKQSEEVAQWLIQQQMPNGSFPIRANSSFAYTRGTGKIFESFALYPDLYQSHLEAAFTWLTRMQYNEQSLYFLNPEFRHKAIGGFRHDHANTEAWTDSAAHFLLGAARLLDSNYTPVDK